MARDKTELFSMRLTPVEAVALRTLAKERRCSAGEVARWAIKTAVIGDSPGGRGKKNEGRAVVLETAGTPLLAQS